MIYFQNTTDFYLAGPTAVTLGKFDGVHRGHMKLIRDIKNQEKNGLQSVVFALGVRSHDLLLTAQEQAKVIEDLGICALVRCPFVPEISGMSPAEFIEKILIGRLHAAYAAVGTDFRFGYKRQGDAAFLKEYGLSHGLTVNIIEKECYKGREISSTYIREAIAAGNMELVRELMGRSYSLSGIIIHGAHLGSRLGMPTANIVPPAGKALPPNGVYYSRSYVDGSVFNSITDIGTKPTVGGTYTGAETFLYDTDREIYGEEITVELLHHTRPEIRFDSVEALKEQIAKDISAGREYFRE